MKPILLGVLGAAVLGGLLVATKSKAAPPPRPPPVPPPQPGPTPVPQPSPSPSPSGVPVGPDGQPMLDASTQTVLQPWTSYTVSLSQAELTAQGFSGADEAEDVLDSMVWGGIASKTSGSAVQVQLTGQGGGGFYSWTVQNESDATTHIGGSGVMHYAITAN